jgi:autophagy-related protein 18
VVDKSIENTILAHESEVGALAVNSEGTLIATASTKGTIIRIFSSEEGVQL